MRLLHLPARLVGLLLDVASHRLAEGRVLPQLAFAKAL